VKRGTSFDPDRLAFEACDMLLAGIAPLIDGQPAEAAAPAITALDPDDNAAFPAGSWLAAWTLPSGERFELRIEEFHDRCELRAALTGFAGAKRFHSLGLRFGRLGNVRRYMRNGYMSWDGSGFVEPEAARLAAAADPTLRAGHAVTALVSGQGGTAAIGFLRHDRFHSRLSFDFTTGMLSLDMETLLDLVPANTIVETEPIVLLAADSVEASLRRWAERVAAASPLPPRLPERRITGWCSWYGLYASISEANLLEHLAAAREFRDTSEAPFDTFLIDDGFVPEMGDWLDARPQFPRGMAALLADIRSAGFTPGLWIAPFMVGNRSRLFAAHPDWVVKGRNDGKPLAPMTFYGEFRWHKRSEEYHVLDITNPDAEAYVREVFRTWATDWGCGYFKTDFMHLGSFYGPDEARWHEDGLSRIQIWMKMARLIREEIGDALWLCCGSPLYPPVGLCDAMRIGRDIGVSWKGNYSAESLLRDQAARNFANGILWQTDPDCILLRDRFHELSDNQLHSLAQFAGLAGGVLMTGDHLGEVPEERRRLLADLLGDGRPFQCDFPLLGRSPFRHELATGPAGRPVAIAAGDPVVVQRVSRNDGSVLVNVFNTGDRPADFLLTWETSGLSDATVAVELGAQDTPLRTENGLYLQLAPHQSRLLSLRPA
jgi:alpha-galactosidase